MTEDMWTVFDSAGKAVANCDAEPDHHELLLRGQRAVFHAENIPLAEILPQGEGVRRKGRVQLTARVTGLTATIGLQCDDKTVTEIPLFVGGVRLFKPPGGFTLSGEAGVHLIIKPDREVFLGNYLEVSF